MNKQVIDLKEAMENVARALGESDVSKIVDAMPQKGPPPAPPGAVVFNVKIVADFFGFWVGLFRAVKESCDDLRRLL